MVRSGKASPERHRKTSSAASQALREVQSESPGRHGGGWVKGGGVEMSGLKERFVTTSLQKTTVCSVILPHFQGKARERPGQTLLLREESSCHVVKLPACRVSLLGTLQIEPLGFAVVWLLPHYFQIRASSSSGAAISTQTDLCSLKRLSYLCVVLANFLCKEVTASLGKLDTVPVRGGRRRMSIVPYFRHSLTSFRAHGCWGYGE